MSTFTKWRDSDRRRTKTTFRQYVRGGREYGGKIDIAGPISQRKALRLIGERV